MTQCNFVGDYYFKGNCCLHLQDKLLPSRKNETKCIINQTTKILAIHFLPKPMKIKTNYSSNSSEHSSLSKLHTVTQQVRKFQPFMEPKDITAFSTAQH